MMEGVVFYFLKVNLCIKSTVIKLHECTGIHVELRICDVKQQELFPKSVYNVQLG